MGLIAPGISSEELSGGRAYILRGHPNFGEYGDPISWVCNVIVDGKSAKVLALVVRDGGSFRTRDAAAIRSWLKKMGVNHVSWSRSVEDEFQGAGGKI